MIHIRAKIMSSNLVFHSTSILIKNNPVNSQTRLEMKYFSCYVSLINVEFEPTREIL
jgi:hypothetical protein